MTVVYIDRVFFLNFVLDYLLLLMTARLAGQPLRRIRFAVCAICGAGYAVVVFLPQLQILGNPAAKIAVGIVLSLVAFWCEKRRLKLVALFFLLSGAMAGLVLAIGLIVGAPQQYAQKIYYAQISWPMLLCTAVLMMLLMHLVFQQGARHGRGEIMPITVCINGRKTEIRALHDTGNTLRDPINGRPVLVLEQSALNDLWTEEMRIVLFSKSAPEEKMAQLYQMHESIRFTLLPFRSVGTPSGLLLAVHSDYIRIGEKTLPHTLIALSDGPVSDGGGYQALWGGMQKGENKVEFDTEHKTLDTSAQQAG